MDDPALTLALATRLARYLNVEQTIKLLDLLEMIETTAGGYGDVAIVMQGGHVRYLRPTMSVDVTPKPKPRPT